MDAPQMSQGGAALAFKDRRLYLLCWCAYFLCYVGKLNYSAAMADMIGDGVLGAAAAGMVGTAFFICYGCGQLINGILADCLPPGVMIVAGVGASAVCNLGMSLGRSLAGFVVVWGCNGLASSMVWAPILRIIATLVSKGNRKRYLVGLPSSMALGTLASYGLSALMVHLAGWRGVFLAAGGVQLLGVAICALAMGATHAGLFRRVKPALDEPAKAKKGKTSGTTAAPWGRVLCSAAVLAVVPAAIVNGFLKDGSASWFPTYLFTQFGISASFSILVTMLVPLINLSGAYAAGFVYKRLESERKTAGLFFGVAVCALLLLLGPACGGLFPGILCLGITTASMMAANTMLVNFYPLRFAKQNRVGTVTGFLNGCAYIGAAICSGLTGYLQTGYGWGRVFALWCLLAAVAGLLCLPAAGGNGKQ